MESELTHALTALVTILVTGGGAYGVQRLRNGAQPPQDPGATIPPGTADQATLQGHFVTRSSCDAHHAEITEGLRKGGTKMDTISKEVTDLTIAVNKAISDSDNKAIGAARDERDAHEDRWHAKG